MTHTIAGAAAAVLLALPVCASAQTNGSALTVQEILSFLVTNLPGGVDTRDVERDRTAAEATLATLTRALLGSIATVPITTSSSGFTYRLNSELGTVERASETFGPSFVERALTSGAGQASFGFTFQFASFDSLDGRNLEDGQLVTISNRFRDEAAPFDIETLALDVTTRTATFYGNVGLSDRVDLGVAVPVVSLGISGTRNNEYRGRSLLQARARAETLGLADIAVRSKVRLTSEGPGSVAAGLEVRLPTGREEDLLGAGKTTVRFQGLASAESGRTSVHGNVTVGTGGLGREYSYGGAVAVAATPQITVVGEVLARRMAGVQRISELITPHPRTVGVDTMRLVPSGEDQTTAFAVAGFKWNVGGTWLLHGNVLFPMTETGLTAKFTPTIALDYSFTR
jgi:hypothetical protein